MSCITAFSQCHSTSPVLFCTLIVPSPHPQQAQFTHGASCQREYISCWELKEKMAGPYVGLVRAEPRDTQPQLITLDGTLDDLTRKVQGRKQLGSQQASELPSPLPLGHPAFSERHTPIKLPHLNPTLQASFLFFSAGSSLSLPPPC